MPNRISPGDEQALLVADILRAVPDKLSRVQSALKPVAQGKHSIMSVDERLIVAQACTTLQFAIADIMCVVTYVTEALKTEGAKLEELADLTRQQRSATQRSKRSGAH
jgi:hypothetical protein